MQAKNGVNPRLLARAIYLVPIWRQFTIDVLARVCVIRSGGTTPDC